MELYDNQLTERIIGAAYEVHKVLGYGFLESVYGNALYRELSSRGIECECQKKIDVYYKGEPVGYYVADMLVEDSVIVELKAVAELRPEHEWQLLNYLAATKIELGLLINFGRSVQVRRKIYSKR